MSTGYDTLTSVEDLIGRLNVCAERKVTQSADPDRVLFSLGFPYPVATTNEQLAALEPFYIDLLQNIEEQNDNNILSRLDKSDDDAILLLYAFTFPLLVLMARKDISGNAQCYVDEAYEIPDIAERIVSNKQLITWCRTCMTEQERHIISVISGAACILSNVNPLQQILSKSKAKKRIRRQLFQGKGDNVGFRDLRKDLAGVVSRDDITSTVMVHVVLCQLHVLTSLHGDKNAILVLTKAAHKGEFDRALIRVKADLDPNLFRFLRMTIFGTSTPKEEIAKLVNYRPTNREPCQPKFVCSRDGCHQPGQHRCSRCKLVGYCSKECQVFCWSEHKMNCKKSSVNTKKVEAATKAARRAPDPALLQQDRHLMNNPGYEYVILLPDHKMLGVQIENEMSKTIFKLFRLMAPNKPGAVNCLYTLLSTMHPDLSEKIRKQLMAEYGVDPTSDFAKNSELPKVNLEAMIESIRGTHYNVDLDSGMMTFDRYL